MTMKEERYILSLHSELERAKDVIMQKFNDCKAPSDFMSMITQNVIFGVMSIEYGMSAYTKINDAMLKSR